MPNLHSSGPRTAVAPLWRPVPLSLFVSLLFVVLCDIVNCGRSTAHAIRLQPIV
jgi:hypothetical protein